MPVRSLSSPVLKWPDAQTVDRAVRRWARDIIQQRSEIIRLGYFGSYARGDAGVGSDLDLIILVEKAEAPFERRATLWDVTELPVPAEVLVYTREEWQALKSQGKFYHTVMQEAVWVYEAP
ncbi:MAG: DNA polymerase subunit beta [Candidatus Fraserbacteria bacterium RBG_16_55_9]|uniref:DNA polymerase subunit beta n=1 Tax=Fraserbacteria sp. (strain RBG_16_55_9) TaxID=1817864 RepID=A0A1F5USC2_FRAXR|nr:MAG: DNA polymerase subunit beta [Candidatus Fraserbacteria bacterium RBG_16_55_9]